MEEDMRENERRQKTPKDEEGKLTRDGVLDPPNQQRRGEDEKARCSKYLKSHS